MRGYKYPPKWSAAQKTQCCDQDLSRTELHREIRRFKMLCSRCMLPFLVLYLVLEEISAAVLPSRFRNKREANWLDQELFSRLPDRLDRGDLSVGDAWDGDGRPSQSEVFLASTELQRQRQNQNQNQYQYQRKANEKRRKVAPLDSIGSFQMSSFRNRKDEPDVYWEDGRD